MGKKFFDWLAAFIFVSAVLTFGYVLLAIFCRFYGEKGIEPVIIPAHVAEVHIEIPPIFEQTPEPITPCYTEEELIQVAKFLYQEARGIESDTKVACIAWVVCNRVDGGYGDMISAIWGYPQIYYSENLPVTDRMYRIAKDVLDRWSEERETGTCEGRVLPPAYFWYIGDGKENYFRNVYSNYQSVWDYSLPSPYES